MVRSVTGGTLGVLSCPPALCPHAEFCVAGVLAVPVGLHWTGQQARPGTLRAALDWHGLPGSAGRLAAALRTLGPVCFEVTEAAGPRADGERYSYTPELGMHRVGLTTYGDSVVAEEQLRELLASAAGSAVALEHGIHRLLGQPWDEALEPLRRAGDGHPVTPLRRTG